MGPRSGSSVTEPKAAGPRPGATELAMLDADVLQTTIQGSVSSLCLCEKQPWGKGGCARQSGHVAHEAPKPTPFQPGKGLHILLTLNGAWR